MSKFSNKVSWIIITFFIGAIIISFTLTGFQGFSSATNAVATVDGTPISIQDYQRVLQMKMQRFSQMFGGKQLTSQQMKQFGVKQSALRDLVTQKLILNYANDMELDVAQKELKNVIKDLPYFKTGDKFDVNKYKQLLAANRMNPAQFESSTEEELKLGRVQALLGSVGVSKGYVKDLQRFKANSAIVHRVQFEKESLTKFIDITKKDVADFVGTKENENVLKSLYTSMESKYKEEEQVKARHILLKVSDPSKDKEILAKAKDIRKKLNPKNFANMAKKYTDEVPGKKSGGDLGFFTRGRMVKPFEEVAFKLAPGKISEPVKTQFGYHIILVEKKKAAKETPFEKVKSELAKTHLQRNARKELHELVDKVTADFEAALLANNVKKLNSLSNKYGALLEDTKSLNLLEPNASAITFDLESIKPIFKEKKTNTIIKETEGANVKLMTVVEFKTDKTQLTEENFDTLMNEQERDLGIRFNQSIISVLEKKAKIVEYPAYL